MLRRAPMSSGQPCEASCTGARGVRRKPRLGASARFPKFVIQGGTLVRRTAYQSCREILTSNRDRRRRSGYRAKVVSSYPDAALLAAAEASHDGSKRIRIPDPNLIKRR